MTKILLSFIICILAAFLICAGCIQSETTPADSAENISSLVSDIGIVFKDTCTAFECGNETAYNEEISRPYQMIAKNQTENTDFSDQTWSSAFFSLNNLLKEKYAFKEWREVSFETLYNKYAPDILDAEKNQDNAAYYRALREYLYAIPDGHVNIIPTSGEFKTRYADIGGGFGFGIITLDSGKVIVSYVANGSEAEKAGIKFGDEIREWNGQDIHDTINMTSYLWAEKKPSTSEGIRLHQQRLLTRAPVGTITEVSFAKTQEDSRTLTLTAYDDGYDTVKKTSFFLGREVNDYGTEHSWKDIQPQISNDTVTYKTLPGGFAYIAVYVESYDVYQPFKEAMLSAAANNAPGIVLDLRFNSGGDDNLASCFAGWFVEEPVFYEYATLYDPGTEEFFIISEAWTKPQPDRYEGPVAVLISPDTISSGEGVAMILSKTGRGEIISWYGTNGAFGMNNLQAVMPKGMYIMFPDGASLDKNGDIQVDSNAELIGGINPDIRIPLNEDTVARSIAGEDVQLTYALDFLKRNMPK